MPKTRTSIALYLILVFASGILVGVVSHRLYAANSASAKNPPQSMSEFRRRYLAGMRDEVGASEAQIVEVNKILEDTKNKVDELAAREKPLHDKIQQDHIDQIKQLLTPQQRIAYDNWRAERARAKLQAQKDK